MKGIALLTMFFLPGTYAAVSSTHISTHEPQPSVGLVALKNRRKRADLPSDAVI